MEEFNDEKFINNYPFQASIETTENILIQMKRSVCKIYNGREKGTGFFCKIHNNNQKKDIKVLITNNHVLGKDYFNKKKKIEISLDDENEMEDIIINEKVFIFTDEKLDITFVEIDENNSINKYVNYLEIDNKINHEKEHYANLFGKKPIYTMHYPEGKKILVSYGILKSVDIKNPNFISHTCSTNNGSSGAPILLLDSLKVIGVHMGYIQYSYNTGNNMGIFMKSTIYEFLKHFRENSLNNKNNAKMYKINKQNIQRNDKHKIIESNQHNNYKAIKNIKPNVIYEKKRGNNYKIKNKPKNIILAENSNILDYTIKTNSNINKPIDEPNKKRKNLKSLSTQKSINKSNIKNMYCDTEYKPSCLDKYPAQSVRRNFDRNENKDYLEYQQTQTHNNYDNLKHIIKNNINNNNIINNIAAYNNFGNNNEIYNLSRRNSNINDNYLKNRTNNFCTKDFNEFKKYY